MAASHSPSNAMTNDPVSSAADTLASAGAAVGSAAREMASHARGFLPAAGRFLSRALYVSCYSASYGVTFPAVLLVNVIPGGIPLAAGLADGARAARDYVQGLGSHSNETKPAPHEPPAGPAAPTGQSSVDDSTAPGERNDHPEAEPEENRRPPARKKAIGPTMRQVKAPGKRKKSSG